jgi:phosphoribosylformylglycinamidine synthase
MARVVVDVMLKPEILDPQGQAVQRALPRLGFDGIVDVRQGKRFEIELDGPADAAALARAEQIAETLLANTVIEQFTVRFDPADGTSGRASGQAVG